MSTDPLQKGPSDADAALRAAALEQLRKKRDLSAHVLAYVLVNLVLIGVWALTNLGGFFWPAFPMLGWGIGLAFHVWDVLQPPPSEEQIQAEMARLSGRKPAGGPTAG